MRDATRFFSQVLQRHLAAALVEERAVRLASARASDIEPLHRMRVALRRLKCALGDLERVVPASVLELPRVGTTTLLHRLGEARDMDTQLAFLGSVAASPHARRHAPGLREVARALAAERDDAGPLIAAALDRARRQQVFRAIDELRPALDADTTLERWAQGRVAARLDKVLRLARHAVKPSRERELHDMRIAARNLRYCLEDLAPLGGAALRPYVEAAVEVQAALGKVHGYDVSRDFVARLHERGGLGARERAALRFLGRACDDARAQAHAEFVALWKKQRRRGTWGELAAMTDQGGPRR